MTQPSLAFESATARNGADSRTSDYIELLKPRVMSLVVFTGIVGMWLAPGMLHPVIAFTAILCIAAAAGASGAINMWYDADIDGKMVRTRGRPIPAGQIAPRAALGFGVMIAIGSVLLMGLAVNFLAASLLTFTIGFYIFVYTIWLKRRTPQNIVIGGASGALPPVIGWVSVTGEISLFPVLLFAIIFVWTPAHFWALALYRADDYRLAGVPMLSVVEGPDATRKQILVYTLILSAMSLSPWAVGFSGYIYGVGAVLLSGLFSILAVRLWLYGSERTARLTFAFSILYLSLIFTLLIADREVLGVGVS